MRFVLWVIICIHLSFSFLSAQGDIEPLSNRINTEAFDESTPVVSRTGDKLFFTRTADPDFDATLVSEDGQITSNKADELYMDRLASIYSQIAGTKILDPSSSVYNQDIWYAPIQEDMLLEPYHPGYPLNNALPNSVVSTGMLPDEFIILNQFYEDGSMYAGFSRVQIESDGGFNFPSPMHIYGFNLSGSDVDMTMTHDGHMLVISMKRSDSEGLNDLFVSFYLRDNVWSAPVHMGQVINTPFQESSPHISPDKRFLYFSSDRTGGKGGSDIYVSERIDYTWQKWTEPTPVKGEVNTSADESQPYFNPEGSYLYFASRRNGTSDIFRQRLTPKPRLKNPIYIKGKILDAATGQPVHSELFWGQNSSPEYLEYFNTYTGEFEMKLTEYEAYKFQPRRANEMAQQILVDPREMEKLGIDTFEMILYVDANHLKEDSPVPVSHDQSGSFAPSADAGVLTFYDIHFVKGKDIILSRSKEALKYLTGLLNEYPGLEIMIEGHTDNVGDEGALLELSIKRAEAIRGYLVQRGIKEERMRISGAGSSRPRYLNISETGRAKNRRVEIHIIHSAG